MNIGISTASFYPGTIETAIDFLATKNVKYIEIFFNTYSELKPEFLKKIKKKLLDFDINVVSIHPFTCQMEPLYFFSEYKSRFADGIEQYEMYFKAAKFLGAKYIVLHGDYKGSKLSFETASERIKFINDYSKQYDVSVILENVARSESSNNSYLEGIKHNLKEEIGFVLDIKQAIRSGHSPLEVLEVMGQNTKHIHISDFTDENDCLLPFKGQFNFETFFKKLLEMNYDGCVMIEVYNDCYNEYNDIVNSLEKTKELLDRLEEKNR